MKRGTPTPPTDEALQSAMKWLHDTVFPELETEDLNFFSTVYHTLHSEAVKRGLAKPSREWTFESKEEMVEFIQSVKKVGSLMGDD